MAETILYNRGDFTSIYLDEEITFSTNTVSTRILSGITAVKTADKDIWVDGPLTYTITVENTTGEELTGSVFRDEIDATTLFDSTFGVYVNGSPAVYVFSANILEVGLPTIGDGETVTITFQLLQV